MLESRRRRKKRKKLQKQQSFSKQIYVTETKNIIQNTINFCPCRYHTDFGLHEKNHIFRKNYLTTSWPKTRKNLRWVLYTGLVYKLGCEAAMKVRDNDTLEGAHSFVALFEGVSPILRYFFRNTYIEV